MSNNSGNSIYPSTLTTIAFYIAVLHPQNNICKAPNTLILDHVTEGYVIDNNNLNSPDLDDYCLNITLGVEGVYRTINAVKEDRLLAFLLKKGDTKNNISVCEDSPYGFKLSEIIERVGDPLKVGANQVGHIDSAGIDGWNDLARLTIVQKAYRIEKDKKIYYGFDFTITNIGSHEARKVTFKDVIPNGLKIIPGSIKLDGKDVPYNIEGRRILAYLPNIKPTESYNLTFVCTMESCTCVPETNVGCIWYITWHAITSNTCTKTIIITQISNIKSICK